MRESNEALKKGNVQQAKNFLQTLIAQENHKDHLKALYRLGLIIMLQDKESAKATSFFSRVYTYAKKSNPSFALKSLVKLAMCLHAAGQKKEAALVAQECKNQIQQSPEIKKSDKKRLIDELSSLGL